MHSAIRSVAYAWAYAWTYAELFKPGLALFALALWPSPIQWPNLGVHLAAQGAAATARKEPLHGASCALAVQRHPAHARSPASVTA